MNNLKFAVGITLYNPTIEIIERINGYLSDFDKVLVFDNSDVRDDEYNFLLTKLYKGSHLIYIDGKVNMGLPYAYNRMITDEHIAGYDYFCTLDQDSTFKHSDILSIKDYITENYLILKDRVAEIAPYIDYGYGEHIYKNLIEEKKWVITSGTFINLHLFISRNFSYDENYFIDKFEIDLCKQFTQAGYIIQMYHKAVLHQRLGEDSGHKHPNHSEIRHYYLARNRLYFNKKFFSFFKRWGLNILQSLRHFLLILLYEQNKRRKIIACFRGWADFYSGKHGKKNDLV